MKKLLLGAVALTSFAAFAQLPVNTTAENRNVVLEEFTGVNCPYCPDGHRLANQLAASHPGDVFLINIHVGSFATPGAGQPDYRTSFGTAIDGQANVAGYPAGTINRQDFSPTYTQNGGTAMGRGDWDEAAGIVLSDASYVNVALDAVLDAVAMTLTVDVEVYYTAAGAAQNNLNVAVLQNGIAGDQSGASSYPQMVNPDGTYNHQHMLRHLMTGQWGDVISTTAAGTLVSRSYTWNIPADINSIPVEIADLEVVAFITEGQQFIVSGNHGPINYVNLPYQRNAIMQSLSSETAVCDSEVNPEVAFRNFGNDTITSVDFSYDINGSGVMTHTWNGTLPPSSWGTTISLPAISFVDNGTNTLNVNITSVNGAADQDPSDNTGSQSGIAVFQNSGRGGLRLVMRQDQYGNEITWEIRDDQGQLVESGGPYALLSGPGTMDHVHPLNLTDVECHTLEVFDSYGDGINSGFGAGKYWIEQVNSVMVLEGNGVYTSIISHAFDYTSVIDIPEEMSVNVARLFPNPADEAATLSLELPAAGAISCTVVNALGQVVAQELVNGINGPNTINLNTTSWEAGLYYITLEYNGEQSVKKLSVLH